MERSEHELLELMGEWTMKNVRILFDHSSDQRAGFRDRKSNVVSESCDNRFYVVLRGICTRKEEGGEELPSAKQELGHSPSNGRFSSSSSTIKPVYDSCDLNYAVDPVANLFEDSDPGIFVTSGHIEFMTRVVESAWGGHLC